MALRFKLLGLLQFEEERGSTSEVMKWHKGCALLAYLAVTGQAQRREFLADLLWDAPSTSQSLQNLRKLLSRMRKWVPELEVTRTLVAYPLETAVSIDLFTLSTVLDSGSIAEMDAVLSLYEGDLLDGFYLDDAPRFNEWLLLEREKLRQRVTAAYRQICFAYSEQSAWDKGIAAAQRWLALDEFDEDALRQLLQLLAASGQIELALQQYKASRQRLWAELAVEPAPETMQLVQRLQTLKEEQGGGLSWSAIVGAQLERPSADQLAEVGELPVNAYVPYQRNNDFTGRQQSLLRIASWLLPNDAGESERAVVISGMGGLGKTQLAVEFCYRYGRYFPGGVFWLSFANKENIAEEVANVGGERGMGLYRDADKLSRIDQVGRVRRAWQESIPRLLIFDNCENESLLADWLPVTGGCCVLLTSRRSQWVPELGVNVYELNTLTRDESVALLQQLAPEAVSQSLHSVQKIVAKLGDLPLALHLAGSFLRRYQSITPQQYLRQLNQIGVLQHPSLQGRGSTYSPTNHELNIARTFAINFEQVDADEETDALARKLLVYAGCFAPGEPIPNNLLLATVQGDKTDDLLAELLAADGLAQLVALGFLRAEGPETTVMHRLVAQFVQAILPDDGAQTAVEQKMIETATKLNSGTWDHALRLIPSVHLRHMMEQALSRQDINSARLVSLWAQYLRDIGDYEAAEQQLRIAQKLQQQILGVDHPETAESLIHWGRLYIRMGKYELSQVNYEQYLAFWQQMQPPDMVKIAEVQHALGTLHMGLGNFALAHSYLNRALDLRVKHLGSDHPYTGFTLINLGVLFFDTGDFETARLTLEQALPIMVASFGEMSPDTANVYGNLGKIYLGLGDLENAWAYSINTLKIREQVLGSDHLETAFSLNNLGQIRLQEGKYEEALAYSERALLIREKALKKDHPHLADSYHQMGKLLLQTGSPEKAITYLQKALAIRECVLDIYHPAVASVLSDLGQWYQAQGNNDVAQSHYERALTILAKTVVSTHPDIQRIRQRLSDLRSS